MEHGIEAGQTWRSRSTGQSVNVLGLTKFGVEYNYRSGGVAYIRSKGDFLGCFIRVDGEHLSGTAQTEPVRIPPQRATEKATTGTPLEPCHLCMAQNDGVRAACDICGYVFAPRPTAYAAFVGNPKDAIGSAKAPSCTVPATIQAEDGLAMLEGALKYGRHNYRAAPVRATVYLDAARRHMARWIEGEEIDPDSGLSHLAKARACFGIIRDAQICGTLIDDRPPPAPVAFFAECDAKAAALVAKYPNPVAPYVKDDPRMAGETFTRFGRERAEVELDALKARTLPR